MIKSKPCILVVLGSGGHFEQIFRLIKLLKNNYDYEFVFTKGDKVAEEKLKKFCKLNNINIVNSFTINKVRIIYNSRFRTILNSFYNPLLAVFKSIYIVLKSHSNLYLSSSSGSVVLIYYLGKLFSKKLVYIECWSRVWNPSLTGRLLYPISNLFILQWPTLKKYYPKAIDLGRL